MRRVLAIGYLFLFSSLFFNLVFAAPVEWPLAEGGNGHYYEVVVTGAFDKWYGAYQNALTRSHAGLRGHLATITSQAENDWLLAMMATEGITQNHVFYLGAWNDGILDKNTILGDWFWITGEPWDFTDWAPGEPTLSYPLENCLSLLFGWQNGALTGWNNLTFTYASNTGFIVEYDELSVSEPPPEHPVSADGSSWDALKSLYR